MGVGGRIKHALKAQGMSIRELADTSGVSVNTLYNCTKSDPRRIDSYNLEKISEALKLPESFFLSEYPFEDLQILSIDKATNIFVLEKMGAINLDGRTPADISNIEYWQAIGKHGKFFIDKKPTDEELAQYDIQREILNQIHQEEYNSMVKTILGDSEELIKAFSQLNEAGKLEAVKRVQELAELPRYRKES